MPDVEPGKDHEIGIVGGRVSLPDWPRLMGLSLAAAYFGVCPAKFRELGIRPVRIGRRILWDRQDLDGFADGMSDRPAQVAGAAAEAKAMERRFFARLKKHEEVTGRRR